MVLGADLTLSGGQPSARRLTESGRGHAATGRRDLAYRRKSASNSPLLTRRWAAAVAWQRQGPISRLAPDSRPSRDMSDEERDVSI
jgi:hypothetical protein